MIDSKENKSVAIYVRAQTEAGRRAQVRACRRHIQRNGGLALSSHVDRGHEGRARENLVRQLASPCSGIAMIVVADPSRLARDLVSFSRFMAVAKRAGIDVVFVSHGAALEP
jgi:DNA invertase Pin-like site-specific DNA recombinase